MRFGRATVVLASAAAGLLGPAASAPAAVISAGANLMAVSASPGEVNHILLKPGSAGGVRIEDTVELHAGVGCALITKHLAECGPPVQAVRLDLGDASDLLDARELTSADLVVDAGSGNDTVVGGQRGDAIDGGSGNDLLDGFTGNDVLQAGGGNDELTGGEGSDILDGGDGADRLAGDGDARRAVDPVLAGSDTLRGGAGRDVLAGGPLSDTLQGDAGTDTASYAERTGPVTVRLDGEADDGELGENDQLAADIETILGGAGPDVLIGSDDPNVLVGGAGDDLLLGGGGPDVLSGGAGADRIYGRDDQAAAVGRPGTDAGADDVDTLDGGAGADLLDGGAGFDVLEGGPGDDLIESRDPAGDRGRAEIVGCGEGVDRARIDDSDNPVGCEEIVGALGTTVTKVNPGADAPAAGSGSRQPLGVPVVANGAVLLAVLCGRATGSTCRVDLTITAAPWTGKSRRGRPRTRGRIVGRGFVTIASGTSAVVALPLNRVGLQLARRPGRVRALAVAIFRSPGRPAVRWARPLRI